MDNDGEDYLRGLVQGQGFERESRGFELVVSFILGLILGAVVCAWISWRFV